MLASTTRFTQALQRAMRTFATTTALSAAGVLLGGATVGCEGLCSDMYSYYQLDFEEASALSVVPRAAALDGDGRGLVVGDAGVILRQEADGTWTDRSPGVAADLHGLVLRGSRALAVGSGGMILLSDDSGDTWAVQESGTEATLRAVVFLDEGGAVAVGDGVVLSSDNGDDWSSAELPAGAAPELRAIGGSSSRAFAVGLSGAALMSEDNGQSWVALAAPTQSDLIGVNLSLTVLSRDGAFFSLNDGEWSSNGELGSAVAAVDPGLTWVALADDTIATLIPDWYGLESRTPLPEGSATTQLILPRDESATLLGEGGERLQATVTEEWEEYKTRCVNFPGRAVEGRPFYVDGEARTAPIVDREGWCDRPEIDDLDVEGLAPELRETLASAWALDGAYEHASIASFARFILDLMAVGAPAKLIGEAQRALADEVRHAQACFDLASAYAGRPRGPGAFTLDRAFEGEHDLLSLAVSTFVEGCVNETVAAVEADVAHALAEVPRVRETLGQIAADETRHAALAWDTLAWCLSVAGAPLRAVLREHFAALAQEARDPRPVTGDRSEPNLSRHGRLGEASRALIAARVRRELVLPRLARLLDTRAPCSDAEPSRDDRTLRA